MGFLTQETAQSNAWSVSELTGYIKELFEIDFRLQDIEVSGEISNFTRARSGHLYFTLKDEQAQLKCVMWRTMAQHLAFRPEEGDAVLAHGRVSVYETGGVYQLYADWLEPAGRGYLAIAFERLKERLSLEGLFDQERKKPVPSFPNKIGIVTSADAAALRDILKVLQRRCPLVEVLIAPTLVQGDQAPEQIVQALRWLDGRDDIDTILVARGGGSIEDLWAFNDEQVARAIFAAEKPVISGVGHETDFTIADLVADLRAPTPSAAAELAAPDLSALPLVLADSRARLVAYMQSQIQQRRRQVQANAQALSLLSPRSTLDNNWQRLDGLSLRLDQVTRIYLEQNRSRLAVQNAALSTVSPLATLSRGYAIVRGEDGRVVRSTEQVAPGDRIGVQVSDGEFEAKITANRQQSTEK
ncbi:MAG: exodeoxyribonuclease VII large subunit [Anaerolineaceae bacterium]|nr:MAG: exodeoxyribonuclease VII large subunit [Anaerolineaceae bacterium]